MSYIGISDETLSIKVHVSGMKHVRDKGMKHVSGMKHVRECVTYMKCVAHFMTILKLLFSKILHEDISELLICWYIVELDFFKLHAFMNIMVSHANMFRLTFLSRIRSKEHSTLVINTKW